ncbi:MAG: hypothetical protein R6U95_08375 [Bacteroidales bacterium]
MKIIALIVLMALITSGLIAQNNKMNWIGVNTSISTGELIRYGGALDGGLSYNGKIGFLIGIGFSRVINNTFDFESGIDYSKNTFNSSYIDDRGQIIKTVNPEHVDLVTIPINIRIKLQKHFFVTGGLQYDQRINVINSPSVDNQTGIGINFTFGKDFILSDKMIVYIALEFIIHDIIPFSPEKNQQRLTEFGLRISYKFGL